MDEFIQDFLIEAGEILDQLDRDLVALEKEPQSKPLLASVFRAVHTIKGTSGTIGLKKLEAVGHIGENLLSRMRDGQLSLNAEITSGLLMMIDVFRQIMSSLERTGAEGDFETAPVIQRLTTLLEENLKRTAEAAAAAAAPVAVAPTPSASAAPVVEAAPTPQIEAAPEAVNSTPQEEPVIVVSAPTLVEPETPKLGELLVSQGACEAVAVEKALAEQQGGDARPLGEILIHEGKAAPEAVIDALQAQSTQKESALASNSIRVDVNLLDKVMDLVGELVLARNQILQYTSTQRDPVFFRTAQRLNLITTELQEGVMKTRMQPIGNVWNKFPRIIRDLCSSCGKQVRLEMEGAGTELDKTILEAIKDPLTHIIRNSVDHGVEPIEQRIAAGKPPEGLLLLRAFHEGGQVNIEIIDDGAGINVEKVKAKAMEKGIISTQQAAKMSEREAFNLIFSAGLSTAAKVTNISGRGVGMDVVKTNIEKIGGAVEVQSVRGHGSTIKIKIPLTLAIIPALIVTSAGERFAIPQVSLLELVRLEGDNARTGIETIQSVKVHRLRGALLPLVYLNKVMGLGESHSADDSINIVVLQAEGKQFGLVVDDINDTEEIVVKPLSKQLKSLVCFAGATIMGDGHVALILDVHGLASMANLADAERKNSSTSAALKAAISDSSKDQDSWLLFRIGEHGRMAMPLSVVSRLEELPIENIERSNGRMVVQYRGNIMPLVDVGETLGRSADETRASMQVVVYAHKGQSIGLVVDEILDIVDQRVEIERRSGDARMLGVGVIQQRVTDLLNVPGVIAAGGIDVNYHSEVLQ